MPNSGHVRFKKLERYKMSNLLDRKDDLDSEILNYASFGRRLIALLLDHFIITLMSGCIAIPLGFLIDESSLISFLEHEEQYTIGKLIFVLTYIFLTVWFEYSKYRATPGKMIMKIIVVDLNGNRVSFIKSLGRYMSKILSTIPLYLGFFVMVFNKKGQTWHDRISGCLVIMKQSSPIMKSLEPQKELTFGDKANNINKYNKPEKESTLGKEVKHFKESDHSRFMPS